MKPQLILQTRKSIDSSVRGVSTCPSQEQCSTSGDSPSAEGLFVIRVEAVCSRIWKVNVKLIISMATYIWKSPDKKVLPLVDQRMPQVAKSYCSFLMLITSS